VTFIRIACHTVHDSVKARVRAEMMSAAAEASTAAGTTTEQQAAAASSQGQGQSGSSLREADIRSQVFQGQLNKFTNVVKGWQYRWFVVRPETGTLDYHLIEDSTSSAAALALGLATPAPVTPAHHKGDHHHADHPRPVIGKCRGSQHLAGCMVVPSEEDSLTFNAIFASGETYKLRASNVKERQVWVDRLRAVAHLHDKAIAQTHPPMIGGRNPQGHHASGAAGAGGPATPGGAATRSQLTARGEPTESLQTLSLSVLEAFGSVHDILHQADLRNRTLRGAVERLPLHQPTTNEQQPTCLDSDLLLIKATSQSALLALQDSLLILQEIVEGGNRINNSGGSSKNSGKSGKSGAGLNHHLMTASSPSKRLSSSSAAAAIPTSNNNSNSSSQAADNAATAAAVGVKQSSRNSSLSTPSSVVAGGGVGGVPAVAGSGVVGGGLVSGNDDKVSRVSSSADDDQFHDSVGS